jgi:hypothetical protein
LKNRFRALLASAALVGAAIPLIVFATPGAGAAGTSTSTRTTTGTGTTTTGTGTTPTGTGTTTTGTGTTTTGTGTTTTPAGPLDETDAASSVTSSSATLSGSVTSVGATMCYFQYGTTTSYGLQTAPQTISSAGPQAVMASLNGLESKTPFHYQVVCTDASGTGQGGDVTFTTTDHGPSSIRLRGHTGFVSSSGEAGIFIGCSGDRSCDGSLSLYHDGVRVGSRAAYFEGANDGGIVHLLLTGSAMRTLRNDGELSVTVSSVTSQGQRLAPGDEGYTVHLYLFS